MLESAHPLPDRLTALAFLSQARWLEWQALSGQAMWLEWQRVRQDVESLHPWWSSLTGAPDGWGPAWAFTDIASAWWLWSIRGQLAAAQGLLDHCALPYLGLPRLSGRRAGFDPGRRRSAVVIDFPDRRRPEPVP